MIDWKRVFFVGALLGASVPTQALAAPTEAAAVPAPLVTVTTEDSVEVRVQGVAPGSDAVEWKWGKLVVSVEAPPEAAFAESIDDETVKRVALVGGEKPRLIVMFRHGARTAKKLTEAATITNTGDGFRLVIPRKHALEQPAEPVAEPPAEVAAAAPVPEKPVAEPVADEEPEPAEVAAAAVEAPAAATEGEPLNLPEPEAAQSSVAGTTDTSSLFGTLGFTCVLLAIGGAFVYWKRRTGTTPGAPKGFTVMGNQVLGPKSRIVLMGLGDRRMLLAVSEAGTTVVDKWSEGEGHVPSTSARADGGFDEASLAAIEFGRPVEPPEPKKTQRATVRAYQPPTPEVIEDENADSTAVNGLLALRRRMEEADVEADEDDAWSQALAARMRAARSA